MRSLCIALLFSGLASAQVVASNFGAGAGCTMNLTSGHTAIVASQWFGSTSTPSVTSSHVTWTQALIRTNVDPKIAIYVGAPSSTVSSETITFSVSGSSFQGTVCLDLDNTYVTTTVGNTNTATFSGTPSSASVSVTTVKNGSLLFAVAGGFRNAGLFAAGDTTSNFITGINGSDDIGASIRATGTNGSYSIAFSTVTNDQGTLGVIELEPPSGITITTPSTIPDGVSGTAYSYTLGAVGGAGAYTWSITAGSLQSGLSLSGAVISGTPTATGSKVITVQATDGTNTQTKAITIGVGTSFKSLTVPHSGASGTSVGLSGLTAGNQLFVVCEYTGSGGSVVRTNLPTDTLSTSLSFVSTWSWLGNGSNQMYLYSGTLASSGGDTIQCEGGNSSWLTHAAEISGGTFLDITDGKTSGSGISSGTATSGTITPVVPNELLYSVASTSTSAGTATVQAPWTASTNTSNWGSGYNAVSSTSGTTVSYTLASNTSGFWGIFAASVRASATSIPAGGFPTQIGAFLVAP